MDTMPKIDKNQARLIEVTETMPLFSGTPAPAIGEKYTPRRITHATQDAIPADCYKEVTGPPPQDNPAAPAPDQAVAAPDLLDQMETIRQYKEKTA